MKKVIKLKEKGNEAFAKGDYSKAITRYSEAIELDNKNAVLFGSRSHAFVKSGQYQRALEDAERAIALKSDWSKGYSRKAAALTLLRRHDDAIKALEEGVLRAPEDAQLKAALRQVRAHKNRVTNPFQMPGALTKLRADPRTQTLMQQPDFAAMVDVLSNTPSTVGRRLSDNRILTALNVLFDSDFKFTLS